MMSKEFLKKLGIFGVTLGLTASPLAFAQEEGGIGDEKNLPGDAKEPVERTFDQNETEGNQQHESDMGTNAAPTGETDEGGIGDEMDLPGDNKEPAERIYDDEQQNDSGEAGFGDGAEAMPGDDDLEDEEMDLPESGETDDPLGQSYENTEVEE